MVTQDQGPFVSAPIDLRDPSECALMETMMNDVTDMMLKYGRLLKRRAWRWAHQIVA